MFSVQQKARWFVPSSQDTSQPRVVVGPGMHRRLSSGNREISIAVPTSRGRDRVGNAGNVYKAPPRAPLLDREWNAWADSLKALDLERPIREATDAPRQM